MSGKQREWIRLGVVLSVLWAVGVLIWGAACWVQLAYLGEPAAFPFAVWKLPAPAPATLHELIAEEFDDALNCPYVDGASRATHVPTFLWSVFITFYVVVPLWLGVGIGVVILKSPRARNVKPGLCDD